MQTISQITTMDATFISGMFSEWDFNLTTQISQSVKNNSSSNKAKKVFIPCNNPENLIDEGTAKLLERILYMSLVPLIELFGITANIINCIVFARQGLKDRINLCLFSLALADVSFLLLIFTAKFSSLLGLLDEDLENYWRSWHHEIVLGPMLGMLTVSNLITIIISVERCICVVYPFTAKKILKTRYMAALIISMAASILGLYSPLNMTFQTLQVQYPATNRSHWVSLRSEFYQDNDMIMDIIYNYMFVHTIPCLSLVVVIVTTTTTVTTLRQTMFWKDRATVSAGERREAAVTKMLMAVCSIYVATMTPSMIQSFIRTLLPGYLPQGKYCNTFVVTQTIAHLCEVINSSVNFVVYFTMGSRFRDTVRQLFGTWREKKESPAESLPTGSHDL